MKNSTLQKNNEGSKINCNNNGPPIHFTKQTVYCWTQWGCCHQYLYQLECDSCVLWLDFISIGPKGNRNFYDEHAFHYFFLPRMEEHEGWSCVGDHDRWVYTLCQITQWHQDHGPLEKWKKKKLIPIFTQPSRLDTTFCKNLIIIFFVFNIQSMNKPQMWLVLKDFFSLQRWLDFREMMQS